MKLTKRSFLHLALTSIVAFAAHWSLASGDTGGRNVAEYNLINGNVAVKGYDPVSFFPEGGGVPTMGQEGLSLDYQGALYYFANMENLNLFTSNPNKYEPTYGGWCATAMASGQKIDFDANYFHVEGNRLFLFLGADAMSSFLADKSRQETRADRAWKRISGENPRN